MQQGRGIGLCIWQIADNDGDSLRRWIQDREQRIPVGGGVGLGKVPTGAELRRAQASGGGGKTAIVRKHDALCNKGLIALHDHRYCLIGTRFLVDVQYTLSLSGQLIGAYLLRRIGIQIGDADSSWLSREIGERQRLVSVCARVALSEVVGFRHCRRERDGLRERRGTVL